MPVVPATWEAEAGGSLEPVRQRLHGPEIEPLHSSLATERDSVSKKKKNKEQRRLKTGPLCPVYFSEIRNPSLPSEIEFLIRVYLRGEGVHFI